jgi:ribose transport system ATP-binding protein
VVVMPSVRQRWDSIRDRRPTIPDGGIVALLGRYGTGRAGLVAAVATLCQTNATEGQLDRAGIAFVHRDPGLVDWMTIAENIALGNGFPRRRGVIDWAAVRERADRGLALVGLSVDPDSRVFDLSPTQRVLVAVARALVGEPKLLVLDEPTSSLPLWGVRVLLDLLRSLPSSGVGICLASRRLDEVYRVADEVVVLRDGRVVRSGPVDSFPPKELVSAVTGGVVERQELGTIGHAVRLELDRLGVADAGPVCLTVRAGEVVGLLSLGGAGHELIGRAVAGVMPVHSGRMRLRGKDFQPLGRADAASAGVAFVRAADLAPAGGDRQVVMSRLLGIGRHVVVLEQPELGATVAGDEVRQLLRRLVTHGAAVLLVSSDLERAAGLCHRALVIRHGQVCDELVGAELTFPALLTAACGL